MVVKTNSYYNHLVTLLKSYESLIITTGFSLIKHFVINHIYKKLIHYSLLYKINQKKEKKEKKVFKQLVILLKMVYGNVMTYT